MPLPGLATMVEWSRPPSSRTTAGLPVHHSRTTTTTTTTDANDRHDSNDAQHLADRGDDSSDNDDDGNDTRGDLLCKADPDASDSDLGPPAQAVLTPESRRSVDTAKGKQRARDSDYPSAMYGDTIFVKQEYMPAIQLDTDVERSASPPATRAPSSAPARTPLPASAPSSAGSSDSPSSPAQPPAQSPTQSPTQSPAQSPDQSSSQSPDQSFARPPSQLAASPTQPTPRSPLQETAPKTAQRPAPKLRWRSYPKVVRKIAQKPALQSAAQSAAQPAALPVAQPAPSPPPALARPTPASQAAPPQTRRPQPPLFSEPPMSRSPQEPRPQQPPPRHPLPQARPSQPGTPLQSPIITVQNVDDNETPHPPPPGDTNINIQQMVQRAPRRPSPHQLSPRQADRPLRRPLPHARGGNRQPYLLSRPPRTAAAGTDADADADADAGALRIMPVAAGTADADPTDPCTAHDVATFDMFWERALEDLRRKKQPSAPLQPQPQPPQPPQPPQAEKRALPEPSPHRGPSPIELEQHQPPPPPPLPPLPLQSQPQSQLQPQLQPQPQRPKHRQLRPHPPPEQHNYHYRERPPPLLRMQLVDHAVPTQPVWRPDRRRYCTAFHQESPDEEPARKRARDESHVRDAEENRLQQNEQQQQHEHEQQQEQQEQQERQEQQQRQQQQRQERQQQEWQRQMGGFDHYARFLTRKPPLLALSETLQGEQQPRGQRPGSEHDDDQHGQHDRQLPWPSRPLRDRDRPGPLLKRPRATPPPSYVVSQPLQLIATREGTVMSVKDYLDAHTRAVIEAREHLRRLEDTDPLLPIERPDLVARSIPPPPPAPAPAPYAVPAAPGSSFSSGRPAAARGVTPCPCCNQYLKGCRAEQAPDAARRSPGRTVRNE